METTREAHARQVVRNLRDAVSAVIDDITVHYLDAPNNEIAIYLRELVDEEIKRRLDISIDDLTPADRDVLDALERIRSQAGVKRGEPFRATRAAIAVESGRIPSTCDCSMYRLERDRIIERNGPPARRTVTILRAA